MSPSITHIVETFIGYDRPTQPIPWDWVKWRADFFHRYTLKSLRAQTFQGFKVFVQAGEKHRAQLAAYPWAPEVTLCFKGGRIEYGALETDYVAITRLDSDDLLQREALAEVAAQAPRFAAGVTRSALVFRLGIYWDMVNKIVGHWSRSSSPFFTHIFPRRVYRQPAAFNALHFLPHGKAGDREAEELTPGRICIVKHGYNWSCLKRGLVHPILTPAQRAGFAAADERLILDRERIVRILQRYGLDPEDVPE